MAISVQIDISPDLLRQFSSQISDAVARALVSTGKEIQKQWEQQALTSFGRTPPISVTEDRARHGVAVEVQGSWVVLQPVEKGGSKHLLAESELPGIRPRFFRLATKLPRRQFKREGRRRYPLEIESPLTRGKRPGRFGYISSSDIRSIATREIQREVEALK